MTEKEVYEALNIIFRDVFDDPEITVHSSLSAKDIDEWDSFNHIYIIVAAELKFDMRFNTSEIEVLENVGEFVSLIIEKMKN